MNSTASQLTWPTYTDHPLMSTHQYRHNSPVYKAKRQHNQNIHKQNTDGRKLYESMQRSANLYFASASSVERKDIETWLRGYGERVDWRAVDEMSTYFIETWRETEK